PLTSTTAPLAPVAAPFPYTTLFRSTSSYKANVAGDFSASIDWGDGTTTVGTVTGGNGSFTVSANGANGHTYADEGTQKITVTVRSEEHTTDLHTREKTVTRRQHDAN